MQVILYSGELDRIQVRKHFPDISPGELPVAGKGICRHMVDLCGKLNATDVLVADRSLNPELAERLGDGSYWSLRLQYINCERQVSLRQLAGLRENFPEQDDEILIFWGLALPDLRAKEEIFRDLREIDPDREDPETGLYLLRQGKFYACVCPLFRCGTLRDYFDINFRLLANSGVFSLPGYSPQAGFGIGRNVAMRPDCDVQPPVLILDNVYLDYGAKLRNGAIIGQYVVVDENTVIDHSIILDNTYIGRNMQLQNKIVNGNRVFDPETDTYVDLDDDYMATELSAADKRQQCELGERLFALLLAVLELPAYLLTKVFGLLRNMPFPDFLRNNYPKFWKVVAGRAQLVRFGSRQDDCIFRYSDLWWPAAKTKFEKNMADVYYYHHRSFSLMAKVAVMSQLKRMLAVSDPFSNGKPSSAQEDRS